MKEFMVERPTNTKQSRRKSTMNIDNKELRQLVFWAHVGTIYSKGGSFQKTIPHIITKYAKQLKMGPSNFCCFNEPITENALSEEVLRVWKEYKKK